MPRNQRRTQIAKLITSGPIASQEQLAGALAKKGIETTQTTLSRDLRSLGVIKRPLAGGKSIYELPGHASETSDPLASRTTRGSPTASRIVYAPRQTS